MANIDEANPRAYFLLAQCYSLQGNFNDAITHINYALKLAPDNAYLLIHRALFHFFVSNYNDAIDDYIRTTSINPDVDTFKLFNNIANNACDLLQAKLKAASINDPANVRLTCQLASLATRKCQFIKAIEIYKKLFDSTNDARVLTNIAEIYANLLQYDNALSYIDTAISMDPSLLDALNNKTTILYLSRHFDEALNNATHAIELQPADPFPYYQRAHCHAQLGNLNDALNDYNIALALKGSDPHWSLERGRLLQQLGRDDQATADLQTASNDNNIRPLALLAIGKKDEAIASLNDIASYINEQFTAARIFALLDDTPNAISYIRQTLTFNGDYLDHIALCDDLDRIRLSQPYKDLFQELILDHNPICDNDNTPLVSRTEETPFTRESGICKVNCTVNNLPLNFFLDTGAAHVSISSVEAQFMLKNDYLSPADFHGTQNYINADGSISDGSVINLRHIQLGSLHLDNVNASVSHSQSAPLLLGQSVLTRLGKVEIDNTHNLIRITYLQPQHP